MNRRGFFGAIGAAVAGFSILPAATTYTRLWKAVKPTPFGSLYAVPNPDYVNAPYEIAVLDKDGLRFEIRCPIRLNELPPDIIWVNQDRRDPWLAEHKISPIKIVRGLV